MVILGGAAVSYKRGTPVFQDKSEDLTPLTGELVAGVGAGVHAHAAADALATPRLAADASLAAPRFAADAPAARASVRLRRTISLSDRGTISFRNVQWCRGGLVFKAHGLLYH